MQSVKSIRGCELVLRVEKISDSTLSAHEYALDLVSMTPIVEVRSDQEGNFVSVFIKTSSGSDEIEISRENDTPQQGRFAELAFPDRPTAAKAAKYLAGAIRHCGGKPRSPQAEARAVAAKSAEDSASALLSEESIPKATRTRLIKTCKARVRERLKAPSTARFAKDPMITGKRGEGLLLLGKVEAQNGFGGYQQLTYLCSVEQFGKQWVPTTVSVY